MCYWKWVSFQHNFFNEDPLKIKQRICDADKFGYVIIFSKCKFNERMLKDYISVIFFQYDFNKEVSTKSFLLNIRIYIKVFIW